MVDDPKAGERFMRTVGARRPAAGGAPPNAAARDAMTAMAQYLTRAPKGVFIYPSHEAANRDEERWRIEAMLINTRAETHG